MHKKDITIAIVHYNQWEKLDTCLTALSESDLSRVSKIVVVDNASMPNETVFKKYESIPTVPLQRIINSKNLGFGVACNQVFGSSDTPYVLALNPDVIVETNTLSLLAQYLDEHEKTGVVGPQLVYPDGTIQDSYRHFPSPIDQFIKRTPLVRSKRLRNRVRNYLMWNKDKQKTEPVDWLVGACLLFRRDVLDTVGYFDERFFLFYEDVDLCRRIWQSGHEVVYHPLARARHDRERLSDGGVLSIFTKKTLRIHLSSALKYFWKWKNK